MRSRNGLWSPFGFETFHHPTVQYHPVAVGMACGARSGLKQHIPDFGIGYRYVSEWPVEPVRV